MFKRFGTFFLDMAEIIFFAVGIFFFVYLLVMRPHKIDGVSMMPNFPSGEFILTERVSYYRSNPQRGDVVVFKPPVQISEDEFIKRVIGLPGETVSINNCKIYINNQILSEKYIPDEVCTNGGAYLPDSSQITVPEGEYFVVGDNRPHSYDSRAWGTITKKEITGKSWVVYWPIKSIGVTSSPSY
jgi:signal peptidase I